MRFLHTADWQIGMKAHHVGEAARHVRDMRIETARKLVDTLRERNVSFILIAGDMFEDNGVDRVAVQKVADILNGSDVPVFIIPGNHDPLVPGSVWEHPAWKSSKNVHVLREEKPVEVPGGLLYPCPVNEKYSGADPTAWIQPSQETGIRIGIAHGTVEGIRQDEPCHPIPRDAAVRAGLDYLALGHWHSTATYSGSDGAVRMAYCGTHETTKFGERDSGNVLVVDIPDVGQPPATQSLRTGTLEWNVVERGLRQFGDLSQLRKEIETMKNPASTLLRVQLTGLLAAQDREEVSRIHEILSSRFLFGVLDTSWVRPSPEDEGWIVNLPVGIIRQAGIKLQELADPEFAGKRPEGTDAQLAARALMELYAIVSGEPQ